MQNREINDHIKNVYKNKIEKKVKEIMNLNTFEIY